MKVKRILAVLALLLAAATVFAGGKQENSGQGGGSSGQPVALTVWGDSFFTPKWQGTQGPVLDKIWKEFESANNAKLNLEVVPYPEFQAKILTALSAGNAPDVAIADQYWLASMVKTGGVQDIGKYWPESDRKDFFDYAVNGVTIDNKVYGIWWTTDAQVLYYRKDVLQKAGFANPPKTWDDLYSIATKLTANDVYGTGLVLAGEGGMVSLLVDYWSLGGELVDSAGKPMFNTGKNKDIMIQVMQFYKKLYDAKLIPSDSITYTSENDMNPRIFAGGYASFFGGTWQIGNIKDNVDKSQASQWEVALRPLPPNGKPMSVSGGFDINVCAKDQAKIEKGAEFVRFLTSPVNMAKFAAASAGLPVRKSVYENDSFFSTDHYMAEYGKILPYSRTRPNSVVYPIISDAVTKALDEYVSGQKSADQALSDAEKSVLTQTK